MAWVAMPPGLSTWVAERIAVYPDEEEGYALALSPMVARYAALPLYHGWWDTVALRANGEIISWSDEDECSGYSGARPVEDRYHWLSALVHASRRHAPLRSLLPVPPPGAIDCHHLSIPAFVEGKVFCPRCCGLGWFEPDGA